MPHFQISYFQLSYFQIWFPDLPQNNIYSFPNQERACIKKETIVLERNEEMRPANLGNENSGNQKMLKPGDLNQEVCWTTPFLTRLCHTCFSVVLWWVRGARLRCIRSRCHNDKCCLHCGSCLHATLLQVSQSFHTLVQPLQVFQGDAKNWIRFSKIH